MEPILSRSFKDYLDTVQNQCKKYGRESLSAHSESEPKSLLYYIGFESPDGWFAIELRDLKKTFRLMPNEAIITEYKRQVKSVLECS